MHILTAFFQHFRQSIADPWGLVLEQANGFDGLVKGGLWVGGCGLGEGVSRARVLGGMGVLEARNTVVWLSYALFV